MSQGARNGSVATIEMRNRVRVSERSQPRPGALAMATSIPADAIIIAAASNGMFENLGKGRI
jgi:hypothetical protein